MVENYLNFGTTWSKSSTACT